MRDLMGISTFWIICFEGLGSENFKQVLVPAINSCRCACSVYDQTKPLIQIVCQQEYMDYSFVLNKYQKEPWEFCGIISMHGPRKAVLSTASPQQNKCFMVVSVRK